VPRNHEHGRCSMERHRKHPAAPEQTDEGFAEGVDHKPDTPEEEEVRRFSEGVEQLPDTPEKERRGRFSEGAE
jgi:hypothetical protein